TWPPREQSVVTAWTRPQAAGRGLSLRVPKADARLTFDMSGGRKQAQPAGGRPLDGRVRRHVLHVRRESCPTLLRAQRSGLGTRIRARVERAFARPRQLQ